MAKQGGREEPIYCAIMTSKYNRGGGSMEEAVNAKNRID